MEALIAIAAITLCIIMRFWLGIILVLVILFATSTPAHAHTDMHKEQREQIKYIVQELTYSAVRDCVDAKLPPRYKRVQEDEDDIWLVCLESKRIKKLNDLYIQLEKEGVK